MNKLLSVALGLAMTSFSVNAAFETEAQELLPGVAVSQFQVVDVNGDNRDDLVYLDSNGSMLVNYATNNSLANLDNLSGTKWRIEYDNKYSTLKYVDFTSDGGVITDSSDNLYKLNELSMTEDGQLTFCTDTSSGLNRHRCNWVYKVSEIGPNYMKGQDTKSGDNWVAYKLVK